MKRGTIVLTQFPFTDLSSVKRRPAVVLSPAASAEGDVVVAFITSHSERIDPNTDLLLSTGDEGFEESGLKRRSLIKLAKLATLHTSIFTGELGTLSRPIMHLVDEKLRQAVGLTSNDTLS